MELITIHDLNAIYGCVGHKLNGVVLNNLWFTWSDWEQQSSRYDFDILIEYLLDPHLKIHTYLLSRNQVNRPY
jgi:hypothetical protein